MLNAKITPSMPIVPILLLYMCLVSAHSPLEAFLHSSGNRAEVSVNLARRLTKN